ncbi:precorrin-3B C(17)-methyltransferase [Rubrobacter marinus]|uniref:Precorrin-3B C(17)-methyltransferase n=1 Tax=Rubrobacter marinus TaxID=2653852 RepID=A0A6G8PZD8_9ACTN|nr:precorrin-3B C(17)-methyltransferase [Rubrobacter marinus]QIN79540.1 precorrin-3B C(17)-methyltransferase [Rubrobacter marinus]
MIGLVATTRNGRRRAAHLAQLWKDATLYPGKPSEALRGAWADCDGIVVFLAAGAAVRLAAPLLADKRRDPGIVCVDDAGRYAVALAGGHAGGANELASRVAEALGAEPVITTASESLGLQALDSFGAELGFEIEAGSDLAGVGAALVSGDTVRLVSDRRWPTGPLPDNVVRGTEDEPDENACESATARIVVSDRLVDEAGPGCVVYRPPSLVVGVGCSRGATEDEILNLLRATLRRAGLSGKSVAALASVDVKADEPGLLRAAESLGVPVRFRGARELAGIEVPNPSSVVEGAVGTPSVAEASVIAAGAELLVEKEKSRNATVAIGRLPVRGKLRLVGLGPGTDALIPPMAREALARSEVVVGLEQYVERIRHLLRPGTSIVTLPLGGEIARAERALAEAREGGSAALVSSGDVGVYAMASPALELAGEDVDVEVVPGITAAQAAASLLGSPLGHDHCSISLSDLLTPWEIIERRVRAAAEGDFVVSLYNPRSRGRDWQLGKVCSILLEHRPPETPVGIVKNAYRDDAEVSLTTLSDLRPEDVDMLTVVVVGSSQTKLVAGRMVTPRGYLD